MFAFIRMVFRNPSLVTLHWRRMSETRSAVRRFRLHNTKCAWCGRTKRLEVHHVVPISVAPELAASEDNMLMLCRKPACHLIIGHDGDFRGRYVENAKALCFGPKFGRRVVKTKSAV